MSMRIAPRIVAGRLAGSLLLGSAMLWVSSASIASAAPKLALAAGQVSNLSGSGFTLTRTAQKTGQAVAVDVTLASNVIEKARPGTTGSLVNGEYAVVAGTRTSSGITAVRVLYSATAFRIGRLARHHVAGTFVAASSSATSLVIKTTKGKELTFTLTATTKFRVAGKPVTSAPAFTDGERLVVLFRRDKATKTLIAVGVGAPSGA